MNTTANRIKELRKKAGLNQSQLAQQTGISEQSISKYECGERNPKIENLEALANFFKVPVSYLRGKSNPNRIKKMRQVKGVSQQNVAKALGLTRQAIALYETGQREPKIETWQKLADFFGVSVPSLQGYAEINIPNDFKFESKQDAIDCIEKIMKALDISKEDLEN